MEEMKDVLAQALEQAGVLERIRSQLRMNVFKVVQSDDPKVPGSKSKAVQETSSKQGQLATALMCDFLETCNLKYTLNVFTPECHFNHSNVRMFLSRELGIKATPGVPLIFTMMKSVSPSKKLKIPQKPHCFTFDDEVEEERKRLMDIDRRLNELSKSDAFALKSPGSSEYEEDDDPCFQEDMLKDYDHVEDL